MPVKLDAKGIEEIIEIKLTAEEKTDLQKSADAVKRGSAEFRIPETLRLFRSINRKTIDRSYLLITIAGMSISWHPNPSMYL